MFFRKKYNRKIYNRESEIEDVNWQEFKKLIKDEGAVILDVRSKREYDEGHIINAINIPLYELNQKIEKVISPKNQLILIYCQSGIRSKKAYYLMKQMGYTNIYNLSGGLDKLGVN